MIQIKGFDRYFFCKKKATIIYLNDKDEKTELQPVKGCAAKSFALYRNGVREIVRLWDIIMENKKEIEDSHK